MMMWNKIKRKIQPMKVVFIAISITLTFFYASNVRSKLYTTEDALMNFNVKPKNRAVRQTTNESESYSSPNEPNHIIHHPFDNKCKFPITNIYSEDIMDYESSERLRSLTCNTSQLNYASMDSEGFIYIHTHYAKYPFHDDNITCHIVILEGGIRSEEKNWTKTTVEEIKVLEAPENQRIYVNSDAFLIRCHNLSKQAKVGNEMVYEKVFAGMMNDNWPKDEIILAKDLSTIGDYGTNIKEKTRKIVERYSIDILGFDSTSRTSFMRHMPRTVETMKKLGYHFLFGYNKVGDNSMVNLVPMLVGDMPEALAKPKYDDSKDLNMNWILPHDEKLDPTKLNFLWKIMKDKYGCKSMFNEDILSTKLGLFNYDMFPEGFESSPADHYYRAYYLAVYENWHYAPCRDGKQIQNEFMQLWRRFAHRYRDICHFGFTFITTLTHEKGLVLELLDENLSAHLAEMSLAGELNNTMSIIMGDHGNRIGSIRLKYTGRIEERMPLMAIRLPDGFQEKYPVEYKNFMDNKFKLTSNFDIHKTLSDVVHMNFGKSSSASNEPNSGKGRGISLFDVIPNDRTCEEAYIAENFCTCMIDASNVTHPIPGVARKPEEELKQKSLEAFDEWITNEKLDNCFNLQGFRMDGKFSSMAINPFVRQGSRTKRELRANAITLKWAPLHDYVNYEFILSGKLNNDDNVKILVRTEHFIARNTYRVVYEPFVMDTSSICVFSSIIDICECIGLLD